MYLYYEISSIRVQQKFIPGNKNDEISPKITKFHPNKRKFRKNQLFLVKYTVSTEKKLADRI
jgi:hypothetical protein